jgi:hypothetical protein
MSSKRDVVVSGTIALAIAIAIIIGTMLIGISPYPPTTTGNLSILLTDPPYLPEGVTNLYITYSNFAVHATSSDEIHGWVPIDAHGTIDLLSLVNVSQTISSVKIKSGDYNLIRFNISSASVTYNGKNYTAFVNTDMLTVSIIGGIVVEDSRSSAIIIDISPMVFNIGDESNPDFVINAVAKAFPVPRSEEREEMHKIGFRMGLEGKAWWMQLQQSFITRINITSATLSDNSLIVNVKNIGNESVKLRLVIVSTTFLNKGKHHILPFFFGAAVFLVKPDGSLQLVLPAQHKAKAIFKETGYLLVAGSSVTLTYNGLITFGLPERSMLIPNARYLVTVIGDGALASTVVVAS